MRWFLIGSAFVLVAVTGMVAGAMLTGSGDSASSGGSTSSSEAVAKRALERLIDGDAQGFLDEVRPDDRSHPSVPGIIAKEISNVQGCTVDGAEVLQEREGGGYPGIEVTFVFERPCGTTLGGAPAVSCRITVVDLGDRWYVSKAANVSCLDR